MLMIWPRRKMIATSAKAGLADILGATDWITSRRDKAELDVRHEIIVTAVDHGAALRVASEEEPGSIDIPPNLRCGK